MTVHARQRMKAVLQWTWREVVVRALVGMYIIVLIVLALGWDPRTPHEFPASSTLVLMVLLGLALIWLWGFFSRKTASQGLALADPGHQSTMSRAHRARFAVVSSVRVVSLYLEYFASVILFMFVNPFGFKQSLLQSGGEMIARVRYLVHGIVGYDHPLSLRLPFDGWWNVANGGVTKSSSHSWDLISQRYAYDFIVVDENGKSFQGNPDEPHSYFALGRPILAAADGVVAEIRDDIPDYGRAGTAWIDWRTRDARGNYVVIQHHNQQYTLYVHLQAKSVCVKPGEAVRAGQVIGRCGHSGHSTEPHLHFQLQDRRDFHTAVGLPPSFSQIERKRTIDSPDGQYVKSGPIERGYLVCNASNGREGVVETVVVPRAGVGDSVYRIVSALLVPLVLLFYILNVGEFIAGVVEFAASKLRML